MKRIPDRDWFPAHGVCSILEVSAATLDRMIKDGRFPSAEGSRGKQRLWSFATVADYCTKELISRQDELYRLMDEIERLDAKRRERAKGLTLAAVHEAALARLRREQEYLSTSVYGDRKFRDWLRVFPLVYPDDESEPLGDPRIGEDRRKWLAFWRSRREFPLAK